MTKREKAIRGLECCMHPEPMTTIDRRCPYFEGCPMQCDPDQHPRELMEDALRLLKAREPITEQEKVVKGLECCRDIRVDWCQEREKGRCDYDGKRCIDQLHHDATALLKAQPPRALSAEEFAATEAGHGWLENWCDPSDGEPEYFEFLPFVWAGGYTACADGTSTVDNLLDFYNQRYGMRVWVGDQPPTDEQRTATPWQC